MSESSILTDLEFEIHPDISYPSIGEILADLEKMEPRRGWIRIFHGPMTSMGVRTLDNMEIITPACLTVFHRLCPVMVMDFYVHIANCFDKLEASNLKACNTRDAHLQTAPERYSVTTNAFHHSVYEGLWGWG
ncbi:hypothetical protein F4604DRAFT_1688466 [Suillus subluteus]|nr:hypothetical protein F4604DRAFT_1688466 [Suillus subluteus]